MLLAALAIPPSGCVVLPRSAVNDTDCPVYTRKLELEVKDISGGNVCGQGNARDCLIIVGGLAAASAAVSGSIVLIGNTLYWLETREKCVMRPAVQAAAKNFVNGLARAGGPAN